MLLELLTRLYISSLLLEGINQQKIVIFSSIPLMNSQRGEADGIKITLRIVHFQAGDEAMT